ncbi:MAG: hypothetical protein M0P16_03465 [Syntrophales bacterium]|nr:hypothetical protein [Syntrophales bacterium]
MEIFKLLINEPPLQVLPSLAKYIGLNEAIVLQQIHYLLRHSEHVHNGQKWVCSTYEQWAQNHFIFWSIKTIKRTFKRLECEKILLSTTDFNKHSIDHTKWYALDYDKLANYINFKQQYRMPEDDQESRWGQIDPIGGSQCPNGRDKMSLTDGVNLSPSDRVNLPPSIYKEKNLKDKTTTTAPLVVVSPGTEKPPDPPPDAPPELIQSDANNILSKFDNTPLQDIISSGVIKKAIMAYNPDAHQEHQPESSIEGVLRLCEWMAAIAKDQKYPAISNPSGFLLALSRKGMDEPAVLIKQKARNAELMENSANAAYANVRCVLERSYPNIDVDDELKRIDGLPPPPELPSYPQMAIIHEKLSLAQERAENVAREAIMKIMAIYNGNRKSLADGRPIQEGGK